MRLCWLVLLLIVTSLACPSMRGQMPASANLQVGHDFWTFKDGAPPDVNSMAQTTDGFLWLGSLAGLFRFDGTRFEPFSSPFGDQLLSANVYSVLAPPSGGLWVGYTFGGFSFVNNGRVTNYGGEIASSTGTVHRFAHDGDGILWAGTTSGLWRFDHSQWQHIGAEWNVPAGPVFQLAFDREGILWAFSGDSDTLDLIYLRPGTRQFTTAGKNLSNSGFTLDADGFVVTDPTGDPSLSDSGIHSGDRPLAYPVLRKGSAQFVDRTNAVWIATEDQSVVTRLATKERLHDALNKALPGNSQTFDLNSSFYSTARLVDREGNIWFGGSKGIHRFFYSPLIKQEFPKGVTGGSFSMAADDDGTVWIGANVGKRTTLYHLSDGRAEPRFSQLEKYSFSHRAIDKTFWFAGKGCLWHLVGPDFVRVNLPPEMMNQSQFLQTITEDQHGGMWVSFGRHGLYRLADGVWAPYGGRDDFPKTGVVIEFTDSVGRVWCGFTKNQLAVLDGDRLHVFGPSDGLRVGNITAISGRGSGIWVGGEFGLQQFYQSRFHNITAVDGEWLRGISAIVETGAGDLWIDGFSGIFHIRKAEISEALRNASYQVKGEHFGRREGLPGAYTVIRPLPSAIEGTDGRLWFMFGGGVMWLDPAAYSEKYAAPPITIQSVSADDKSYAPASRLSLPARTSSVQISYSAISLSDPEAIRFRYKLQEADKDWHEVATANPVTYRNLPPGSYHFIASASDTNGNWSDKLATAEFTILPAFYETTWFRSLCVIAFLAFLAVLHQLRLRQQARQFNLRLEARINERTRIARELHDTLLQSFQGLMMKLYSVTYMLEDRPEAMRTVENLVEQGRKAITEGRDALQGLRSSAVITNDLARSLTTLGEELAAEQEGHNHAAFHVEIEGESQDLHPIMRGEVYRIASESVRNAFHHACASRIEVEILYDERQFRVLIRDNGKGIDAKVLEGGGRSGHYGLPGMQERAKSVGGKLTISSKLDCGTETELTIPASLAYPNRALRAARLS